MILSLVCLQVSDYSQVLLDLLCGVNNIAYLLPKKFVCYLLSRRNGQVLNLNPDVVAEAFASVEDPLVIVCLGSASPEIHAPCATFVDPRKSKNKILNILFPRKTPLCDQKPSNDDDCGMILPAATSNPLVDENLNVIPAELQMNRQVREDISDAFKGTKGVVPNTSMMKIDVDTNTGTLATALADKELCVDKDATVIHEPNVLQLLSSSLINSIEKIKGHSLVTKTLQGVVERLQFRRKKTDDFLNHSAMSHESKTGQIVSTRNVTVRGGIIIGNLEMSESSSTAEIGQTSEENNHVEGTGDESVVLGNQSGDGGNNQDAENNEGEGRKRNEKNKGKKIDDFLNQSAMSHESKIGQVEVLESSSTAEIGETSKENKKGKKVDDFLNHSAMSHKSKIWKMVVSESSSTTKIGKTSEEKNHVQGTGDDSVVLGNQIGDGGNTQDAESNKGEGRKRNKNNKGKMIDDFLNHSAMSHESKIWKKVVPESSSTTEIGQTSEEKNHVQGTGDDSVVLGNQVGNSGNTQDAESNKGEGRKKNKNKKGKKVDDFLNHSAMSHESKIWKMVVSESSSTTEIGKISEQNNYVKRRGDDSVVLGNQIGDGGNTKDAESNKGEGRKRNKNKKGKKVDDFLNHSPTSHGSKIWKMVVSESSSTTEIGQTSEENNHAKGDGGNTQDVLKSKGKGRKKNSMDKVKKMDDFLNHSATSHKLKIRQMAASSSTAKIGQTSEANNHVKGTVDDHSVVLENQSTDGGNTPDAENENGKGRKKNNKNKGEKKLCE